MMFNAEIKNLYKKTGYLDKYGGSVVIALVIFIVFIFIFSYYYVFSFFNSVKQNWMQEKCNPKYLAFAGLISPGAQGDKFNYSAKNFDECVSETLKDVAKTAVGPINYAVKGIVDVQQSNLNAIKGVREQINYVRNNTTSTVKNVMNRLIGFLIPTEKIILKIRDTFQKATGVITTALYNFYGFMVILKSTMGYIITTIITFLVALAASITLQFAIPFNWEIAQLGLQFFLLLAVPAGIVSHWFKQTFDIHWKQVIPANPRCFDEETPFITKNGIKKIIDIKLNDQLLNGGIVTAILKLSTNGEKVYNVNGVIVTGTHMIFHKNKGWILVSEHEKSVEITNYNKPYVYCINTSTKMFKIKDNLFLDWDETNDVDFSKLKKQTNIKKKSDIHKFLDGGFEQSTLIEMKDGVKKKIMDIKINDILKNNEKVLGLVKINGENLDTVKKYKFKNFDIIGGSNLQIINNLGNISTSKIFGEEIEKRRNLYHLVTDTKSFYVDRIKFLDYNGSLEVFD
jgi:hypothetical protein